MFHSYSYTIQVVCKIDLHLVSGLFLLFIFNILDRSNIANARLGAFQKDLGLNDTQYQTAVAIMVRMFPLVYMVKCRVDIDFSFHYSLSDTLSDRFLATFYSPEYDHLGTFPSLSLFGVESLSALRLCKTSPESWLSVSCLDLPSRLSSLLLCTYLQLDVF